MDADPAYFEIHPNSGVPIYRQLIDQVHALIAGGKLQPGDLLPSVRQVGQAAAVNPMTVSKAYSLLESERVVERVRGQGMRVLEPIADGSVATRQRHCREQLAPAFHRAKQLGLSERQLRQVIESLLKGYGT